MPSDFSKSLISPAKVKRLVSRKLTLNRAVLASVEKLAPLDNKALQETVLKVVSDYQQKAQASEEAGMTATAANADALNDGKLLLQRVSNQVTYQVAKKIQDVYAGTKYVWLPSSAEEPDPLHQLNYGKTFVLGEGDDNGEDPGQRYGCQCGMRILTDDEELNLFD